MSIPPQTYMLDKNNTHIQEMHTSQFPRPSNTTIETNKVTTTPHQKQNQNFTNKSTKTTNPSTNITTKDTANNTKQHNIKSPPSDPTKTNNNNPPKIPDYKIPSFFIPKIAQVNPKQFISHLAYLPIFFSNSGPTFKIHITNSGLFVITPFTQTGANFLKTPILFPHNNESTFISLNPITNNIPLRKFIIKNIPNHLNTSHFSHMPHLFKCHPLAQPNTTNTNKKTWSLIIYSVNPPLHFSTLNQTFPIHQYFTEPNRCTNCQKFNHLKHQCSQTFPTCVFCSESHQSNICYIAQAKGKNLNLKCANCELNHAASSKTCSYYQNLLPLHHPNLISSPSPYSHWQQTLHNTPSLPSNTFPPLPHNTRHTPNNDNPTPFVYPPLSNTTQNTTTTSSSEATSHPHSTPKIKKSSSIPSTAGTDRAPIVADTPTDALVGTTASAEAASSVLSTTGTDQAPIVAGTPAGALVETAASDRAPIVADTRTDALVGTAASAEAASSIPSTTGTDRAPIIADTPTSALVETAASAEVAPASDATDTNTATVTHTSHAYTDNTSPKITQTAPTDNTSTTTSTNPPTCTTTTNIKLK